MKTVYLDIMVGNIFVAQLPYKVNPIFPATDKELRTTLGVCMDNILCIAFLYPYLFTVRSAV